jgi:hypothetical protein
MRKSYVYYVQNNVYECLIIHIKKYCNFVQCITTHLIHVVFQNQSTSFTQAHNLNTTPITYRVLPTIHITNNKENKLKR